MGLIEPLKKVHHVEVYRTTEDGEHVEDRFLEGVHKVPDEIAQLLYPAELARLMSAMIDDQDQHNKWGVDPGTRETPGPSL
jgi:2-phosphoglycerate kinase